jgi:ferredoxin
MEVEVKFEREDISGVVPVGSYLFDAARRMGIEVDCERRGESDLCAMRVKEGGELLSETTKAEKEHLTAKRRKNGERLACQAKFEQTGEVVIMTTKKKEAEKPAVEEKYEAYRKEFEELPLEKKVANLLQLEAITFSETISFVLNSPSMIVGKIMDVMAEFGLKMEDDAKKATRPNEHNTDVKAEKNGNGKKAETSKTNNKSNEET